MCDEKDEDVKWPWEYGTAIGKKETCATCNSAGGPFMIQGARQPGANSVIAAQVCVCENLESPDYMSVQAIMRSCWHWSKREAVEQPTILVAHKPPPSFIAGV